MLIKIEHVTKTLKGRKVLDDIDTAFHDGMIYGLQGHNGCGKTMMMRLIIGLIRPDKGTVMINDKVLGKDMEYPESLGMLIENPAFLNDFSGRENLEMIAGLNEKADRERIRQCLEEVGLKESAELAYKKYSLGMKQRLGIAAAIMEDPEIVLLDEPTNALDEEGVVMITDLIRSLKKEGRIILVASHDKDFLNTLADQKLVMNNGRIDRMEEMGKNA